MTANPPPDFRYLEEAEKAIVAFEPGTEFVNADIYARLRAAGWPDMTEPRQFGPLMKRLRKEGVIAKVGFDTSPARSHGGIACVWKRVA